MLDPAKHLSDASLRWGILNSVDCSESRPVSRSSARGKQKPTGRRALLGGSEDLADPKRAVRVRSNAYANQAKLGKKQILPM